MNLAARSQSLAAGLAAALILAAPAAADTQYVQNGSFEGSVSGWTPWNSSLRYVSGGVDAGGAAEVTRTTGSQYGLLAKPVPATQAGMVYTARASIRSARPGDKTCLRIRELSGGSQVGIAQNCVTATSSWQQAPALAYRAQGAARQLELTVYVSSATQGDRFQVDGVALFDDTTPPDTTITSAPSGDVVSTTASVAFAASEGKTTFECGVDGAAFASCTSPLTMSKLKAGAHTVQVRALDQSGNADASPASATWTVVAPDTSITAAPSGETPLTTASVSFTSPSSSATFECSADGAAFAACTSPYTVKSLGGGQHTVQVRAVDDAGNADQTPAAASWTVVPPDTAAGGPGPAAFEARGTVTIPVSSNDPAAGFECAWDGGDWAPCAAPIVADAANGPHTLQVRAKGTGGADASPLSWSWWEDALLPNGGFNGAAAGWDSSFDVAGWKPSNATLSYVPGRAGRAVRVSGTGGGGNAIYAAPHPVDATVAGRVYQLTGWTRSDTPGTSVCLRAREYDAAGSVIGSAQSCLATTNTWQPFPALSYTALGGGQLGVDAFTWPGAAGASFDVDAVSVEDGRTRSAPPGVTNDNVLLAVGDIASCYGTGDEETARLLDSLPGTIQTLGDGAYQTGTLAEYQNCFGPTWGRHKARVHPAVGGHDYNATPDAAGFFDYWGNQAGPRGTGWYSYDFAGWHIVVLNTECAAVGGCGAGSPEEQWLRADLAAHRTTCTAAAIEDPRFSSGSVHGNQDQMQPFWQALYDNGADIVLSGADHVYERFAPLSPAGQLDPDRGVREFIVGTGGGVHYSFASPPQLGSEARIAGVYGILKLVLAPGAYSFQFVPQDGKSATDSGSGQCHADLVAPETTLTSTPPAVTRDTSATLGLTATDPDAQFQYSLDSGAWTACSASCKVDGVAPGKHTVAARAVDGAGNADATPVTYAWQVLPPAQNLLTNAGFENGAAGWYAYHGTSESIDGGIEGTKSLRVTWNDVGSSFSLSPTPRPVTSTIAGQDFTAGGAVKSQTPGKSVCLRIRELDSSGDVVGDATSCVVTTADWQRFAPVKYVALNSGDELDAYVYTLSPATGDSFDVDDLTLLG